MKRCFLVIGLILLIGMCTVAFAAVSVPTVYCDGSKVSTLGIYDYDIADGTLTITWDKQSDASKYYYKCIGLNEKPDFNDSYQSSRGTVLAEKTVTSHTTSSRKFTVSTSKMEDYDYLKIAVATYDSAGTAYWLNFGVELTDSSDNVTAPDVTCDGGYVDPLEIVKYDLADGSLTIKWTPQTSADHYYYKCIGLNEKPDFDDSYQSNRGTVLAEKTVTTNTSTSCKFSLTTSKMEDYSYLKVAIAAYDSKGTDYWTNFGVQIVDSSAPEMTLSDTSLSFSYSGDSDTVTVSGVSSFTVSHPTDDETVAGNKWLTVTKSGSSIKISARANYSASTRSETITVKSSDGQTGSIKVTQKSGYAAPTASIRIANVSYSSGSTYGPLANGGDDMLWLYVDVKNARRVFVNSNEPSLSSVDHTISASSSTTSLECPFKIPKGLAAGTYVFSVYVSNSDVRDDKWNQAITPITLNVNVINASGTQTYNPTKAIAYARKWTDNTGDGIGSTYNPEFGYITKADCANYVSQCLLAGGFQMDDIWWWKTTESRSLAWANTKSLRSYLSDTLGYKCIASPSMSDIHAGDIIWSNGGGHVMIVTEVGSGYFTYCGHNNDTKDGRSVGTSWLTHVVQMPGTGGSASEPTTTFSGSINGVTVRLGEKAQLSGNVNLTGNSSINRVTVNVQGYYEAVENRVFTKTFSNGETSVKLQNYSEFIVDTAVAPFNVAGTYTIRLWASAHDGTGLEDPIAEATVVVAEQVKPLPSYTEDELYQHLYIILGKNEAGSDYGKVNANDNGSASIGKIQWNANANRALPLLKKIVAKNPTDARAILGDSLYNEIASNHEKYWGNANRTFTSSEAKKISALLTTSYGIEVQEEQIKYDLTTKNLATIRGRGVKDPWAIIYLAEIYNVGDFTESVINKAAAEVGGADKINLDTAHKYTQASNVYGREIYSKRLSNTYNYLKGVTFNGQHYNESNACTHSSVNWSIKQAATCTATGLEESRCTNCGAVVGTRSIAAKGHTAVKDAAVAATCTTAGKTEGSHCSVCNTVITAQTTIAAKGHTTVKDAAVAATCTKAGKTEGSHCSVCGTVIKAQTTIAATGHDSGKWVVTKEPTATQTGLKELRCTKCNYVLKSESIPVNHTHTVVKDAAVAATCTKSGKTEGSHCSTCGEIIKAQTTIAATGHDSGKWVVTKEATTAQAGLKELRCTKCNYVLKSESIPKVESGNDDIPDPVVQTVNAKKGETIKLNVYVSSLDATLVEIKTIIDTNVFELIESVCDKGQSFNGTFTLIDTEVANGINGKIGTLTLKVKDTAMDGTYSVTTRVINCGNENECPTNCKVAIDMVKVSSRLPGDVNSDGTVNSFDLLRLYKYFGGYDVVINEANSMVNGDGVLNSFDLLRLYKYFGGYPVQLE